MSERIRLSRQALIPDALRVARCLRAPELGPRIVFFSGGSALRGLSRTLKQYTHNSVHLITAFDSGGSSAKLRQAFSMPAIGDLRSRIVALADESVRGNPQIYRLFCHRLPFEAPYRQLTHELRELIAGENALVGNIPEPMRQIVQTHLRFFADRMPEGFDLRGANLGNLMLAGGYLANARNLDSVLFLFSKLLEVRGTVRPVVDVDLHLCAELKSDARLIGQHRITAKGASAIPSAVRRIWLVNDLKSDKPTDTAIGQQTRELIESAELLCLPMGSFYTSVVANLLPRGVGQSIVAAGCPRVYIPNTGSDSEQRDMSVADSLEALLHYVRRDAGSNTPMSSVVNLVLLDKNEDNYSLAVDRGKLAALGVGVLSCDLTGKNRPGLDPKRLTEALLSFV